METFPSACPLWLWGGKARVLLYDPDYMKVILGRSDPKSHGSYRFLAPWIGYGLLLLNGQTWFQHRRMLTPAFHYDILKPYVALMADSVRVMLDKWEKLLGQDSPLEVFQHVSLMTLDTIMKCAFSHQGSIQVDRNSQSYIQAISDLNNLTFSRARNVFHQNDTIYSLTSAGRWTHRACQLAHQHTGSVSSSCLTAFPRHTKEPALTPQAEKVPRNPAEARTHSVWGIPLLRGWEPRCEGPDSVP